MNHTNSLPSPISNSILDPVAQSNLDSISSSLHHAFKVRQLWRTETEMRVSVLTDLDFPTAAAKWWQSVREQCVFVEQLAELSFDFRKNEVGIKRFQRALGQTQDSIDQEEIQIELEHGLWKRSNMLAAAADRVREILLWEKIKTELNDGSFNTDDVNDHQLESYTKRFMLQATLPGNEHMTGGERNSLLGQLATAVRRCEEVGITQLVKETLAPEIVARLIEHKIFKESLKS